MIEVPAAAYAAAHAVDAEVQLLEAELDAMREAAERGDEARFTAHDKALHHAVGAVLGPRSRRD